MKSENQIKKRIKEVDKSIKILNSITNKTMITQIEIARLESIIYGLLWVINK